MQAQAPSLTLPRERGREFAAPVPRERGREFFSSVGIRARPGSAMRPSASSFFTRAMFDSDQLLFGLRGVKRQAEVASSMRFGRRAIQLEARDSSTDC